MNHLLIGTANKTVRLIALASELDDFILIDDGAIADAFLETFPVREFDVARHSFNPLRGMDYRRAADFAAMLYSISPEGKDTLTVRNGRRALKRLLMTNTTRLDKLKGEREEPGVAEALDTVADLLLSPVLSSVLCGHVNFHFPKMIVAKIDRATLGEQDAFALASLLIGQHKGHVIVPDGGFYVRDFYMSLIRQNRLIIGLEFLSELTPKLQQAVLSIKDKTIYRTTPDDAERLVFYTKHTEPRNIYQQGDGDYLTSAA